MGPKSFVQPRYKPAMAHGFMLSHHGASPLLQTETPRTQNENTCLAAFFRLLTSPRPPHTGFELHTLLSLFIFIVVWSSLIGSASATNGDRPTLLAVHVEDDLAWKGSTLQLDSRSPPKPPLFMPPLQQSDEEATQASKRAISIDPSAGKSDFQVPEPFDTGFSSNFTSSCTSFLNRLRADNAFRTCRPFSLMLQTSSGFFDASRSNLRITQTLDATCGVNVTQCTSIMDSYARELMSSSACKTDLDADTPIAIQALNGLVAYPVAYSASCLRDTEGSYCFANAVSNMSSTTDSYPYYLPVGQELPAGSRPTCNSCLQDAMAVFAQYANNVTQPVSKTYVTAAQQLSIGCGRSFVNVTAAPLKAGATTAATASLTPSLTLVLMIFLCFFR